MVPAVDSHGKGSGHGSSHPAFGNSLGSTANLRGTGSGLDQAELAEGESLYVPSNTA
jgi:hypothetical protein